MIVTPFTCAFTSRRRFTLLKVFSAAEISSFVIPHCAASAAAAVAFQTLYSPAKGNWKSAHAWPFRRTDHEVCAGSSRRFAICQSDRGPAPYRSTGEKALLKHRSRLALTETP